MMQLYHLMIIIWQVTLPDCPAAVTRDVELSTHSSQTIYENPRRKAVIQNANRNLRMTNNSTRPSLVVAARCKAGDWIAFHELHKAQ